MTDIFTSTTEAGSGANSPLEKVPLETFDAVLALNLRSALVTSQAVATRLVAQGGGGAIVHLASIAALSGMPFGAAYAAAKAGLLAVMRTQAVEWSWPCSSSSNYPTVNASRDCRIRDCRFEF